MSKVFLVGIFFDALVSGTVAFSAILFVIFLFRRWGSLDYIRRSYAWFWFFTMLTWITIAIRYFSISFGYAGIGIYIGDILVEGTIFFTGPPLFYYLSSRLFQEQWIKNFCAIFSAVLGIIGFYFVLQPGGMSEVHITDFSADVSINLISLIIFSSEIVFIIGFILYDIFQYFWTKKSNGDTKGTVYQLLYSVSLLIYISLGAIDQSKLILDWPLVVFRIFYAGAFLFAYLVIVEERRQSEQYLVEQTQS